MACKFPGAENLDSFWRLLLEGGNTVTEGVPGAGGDRLADLLTGPGARNEACRYDAFVEGIEQFDVRRERRLCPLCCPPAATMAPPRGRG